MQLDSFDGRNGLGLEKYYSNAWDAGKMDRYGIDREDKKEKRKKEGDENLFTLK